MSGLQPDPLADWLIRELLDPAEPDGDTLALIDCHLARSWPRPMITLQRAFGTSAPRPIVESITSTVLGQSDLHDELLDLAGAEPGFIRDVATGAVRRADGPQLASLAARVEQLPRLGSAAPRLAVAERIVEVTRRAAAADAECGSESVRADLASALNNLGVRYSENSRRSEAVAPTEEAVKIYRGLAAVNDAFLADLATALNNLGNLYSEHNRPFPDILYAWNAVLDSLTPPAQSLLRARRAQWLTDRHSDSAALIEDLSFVADTHGLPRLVGPARRTAAEIVNRLAEVLPDRLRARYRPELGNAPSDLAAWIAALGSATEAETVSRIHAAHNMSRLRDAVDHLRFLHPEVTPRFDVISGRLDAIEAQGIEPVTRVLRDQADAQDWMQRAVEALRSNQTEAVARLGQRVPTGVVELAGQPDGELPGFLVALVRAYRRNDVDSTVEVLDTPTDQRRHQVLTTLAAGYLERAADQNELALRPLGPIDSDALALASGNLDELGDNPIDASPNLRQALTDAATHHPTLTNLLNLLTTAKDD